MQLARGVVHLHRYRVLHRDLRAANVLVASESPLLLKWADFGVSVMIGEEDVGSKYARDEQQ